MFKVSTTRAVISFYIFRAYNRISCIYPGIDTSFHIIYLGISCIYKHCTCRHTSAPWFAINQYFLPRNFIYASKRSELKFDPETLLTGIRVAPLICEELNSSGVRTSSMNTLPSSIIPSASCTLTFSNPEGFSISFSFPCSVKIRNVAKNKRIRTLRHIKLRLFDQIPPAL